MGSKNASNFTRNFAPAIDILTGAKANRKQAATREDALRNEMSQANAKAAEDLLTANESVAAQKERARKKTVFGGSTDSNLFNKSLIGSSTTAAAGTQRSILGA